MMDFSTIPWVARLTPSGGGGGSLSIVQNPDQTAYTSVLALRQTLSAVGSGNAIAVVVLAPASGGTPTMSDSAGGTWGAALHSYAGGFGNTFWFFARANVSGNPTWVEATFGGAVNGYIAAVEVSGAGSSLVADDTDGAAQSASTALTFPYTSTVNNTLFLAACTLSNGSVPTGVAPVTATGSDANFQVYGRGIITTAGSGTAQINLADSRSSDKGWVILRPGP